MPSPGVTAIHRGARGGKDGIRFIGKIRSEVERFEQHSVGHRKRGEGAICGGDGHNPRPGFHRQSFARKAAMLAVPRVWVMFGEHLNRCL